MTEIYLGYPPEHIKNWIIEHSKPTVKAETHIKFVDGTEGDYLIEGAMDIPALIVAGLMPEGSGTEIEPYWPKHPLEINVGGAVTSIGTYAFSACDRLTSITIPDSVTSIGDFAFSGCARLTGIMIPDSVTSIDDTAFVGCHGLTDVTFSSKDKAMVQSMENYSWNLYSGCVLHCTDGDITISE